MTTELANAAVVFIFILFVLLVWRGPKRGIPKYKNTPPVPPDENKIARRVKDKLDYFQSLGMSEPTALQAAIEITADEHGIGPRDVVEEILSYKN
jgi:hypothetical protein